MTHFTHKFAVGDLVQDEKGRVFTIDRLVEDVPFYHGVERGRDDVHIWFLSEERLTLADHVQSNSDERVANNTFRHQYRVLSDDEKQLMSDFKDVGIVFEDLIRKAGTSRELSIALTKMEEAVMWAVKHVTK